MLAIHAESLRFRLSIMADIVMALADAALAVLLFLMFRPVSALLAMSALVFRLLQSGLIAADLLNLQAALLASEADRALSFIALHAYGYDLGLIFFAANCFLTAQLIFRSGFVPRLLGLGIGMSGLVYLTGSIVAFCRPGDPRFRSTRLRGAFDCRDGVLPLATHFAGTGPSDGGCLTIIRPTNLMKGTTDV